jgi:hypothetical protein
MINAPLFIVLLAVANAMVIVGVQRAFRYETFDERIDTEHSMIFGWVHLWMNKNAGAFICKPLFSCVACMASFHSLYFFWPVMIYLTSFEWYLLWVYVLYIPAVSTISVLLENSIER